MSKEKNPENSSKSYPTTLDIFNDGEINFDEPLCGWDKWVEWFCPRDGWHEWGLDVEGIPLDQGIKSKEGLPPLPIVRRPTSKELEGLKEGTRPDLVEKIKEYRKIVELYFQEADSE